MHIRIPTIMPTIITITTGMASMRIRTIMRTDRR
jgi:hypothetical protein